MLRPADTKGEPIDWTRNAKILNAGVRAVREARAADGWSPQVMLHVAQPENVEPWFAAAVAAHCRMRAMPRRTWWVKTRCIAGILRRCEASNVS